LEKASQQLTGERSHYAHTILLITAVKDHLQANTQLPVNLIKITSRLAIEY